MAGGEEDRETLSEDMGLHVLYHKYKCVKMYVRYA